MNASKGLPKELADKWDAAFARPGEAVAVGRLVCCDYCDKDMSESAESGGLIFESKAVCPDCAPALRARVVYYGEERFIRASCPSGQSFADFVRAYRGPDASIKVSGDVPEPFRGRDV